MNFVKRLSKLNEALLLEYNRKDLRNWAGDDYAAKFFELRPKLQPPENNLDYWIKKNDLPAFKKMIDDWESGAIKSKTQQKKDERIAGAELIKDEKGWKVYHVTTYEAAKQLGSNTTWCITGRYRGYESKGKYYFDSYIKDYNLDGYYFIFDTLNRDHDDVAKYCAGITKNGKMEFLYNGMQDSEISSRGIPNIPPERQIELIPGIKIRFYTPFKIEDGVLIDVDPDMKYNATITVPEGVKSIKRLVFMQSQVASINWPSTLEEIGSGAFAQCGSLTSITIPDSVNKISQGILLNCNKLEKVKFSDNLTEIPAKTCKWDENLKEVILPSRVNSIADDAFDGCPDGEDGLFFYNANDYAKAYANKHNFGVHYE